MARVGVAAAVVQVIGLLRWPLIVPWLAREDATDTFGVVDGVLGTVIGETFGYTLTALWTVLIVQAFRRRIVGRWFVPLGFASAALILTGILVPLDVPGADFTNFVGYVLRSLSLIAFAATVWRRDVAAAPQPNGVAASAVAG